MSGSYIFLCLLLNWFKFLLQEIAEIRFTVQKSGEFAVVSLVTVGILQQRNA